MTDQFGGPKEACTESICDHGQQKEKVLKWPTNYVLSEMIITELIRGPSLISIWYWNADLYYAQVFGSDRIYLSVVSDHLSKC
jgi:hypothetical protein